MHKPIDKFSHGKKKIYEGEHRFEHWYVDNQVYFVTARCRDKYPAFVSEAAKSVFWDRFMHYTGEARFTPWVASLMTTHYHVIGYCSDGQRLKTMMQRIHGSVAKLTNDLLPQRLRPFWSERGRQDYFDGCIRNEVQFRRAYRYVLSQSVRHGLCRDWRDYPGTRVWLELGEALGFATSHKAFLPGVPYRRYERKIIRPPP